MKNSIFIFALIFSVSLYAQRFTGKATYVRKPLPGAFEALKKTFRMEPQPSDEQLLQMLSPNSIYKKVNFILTFDSTQSTFVQRKTLSKPRPGGNDLTITLIGEGKNEILYKNFKEQKYLRYTEVSGKKFLVTGALEKQSWKLMSETKKIGRYNCRKAVFTKKINVGGDGSLLGSNDNEQKSVEQMITAWYTPQIPVNDGPDIFGGLPGLVLEVQTGKTVFSCTELVITPKNPIKVKKPTGGKKVTQEEFDKIKQEFIEEMESRNDYSH